LLIYFSGVFLQDRYEAPLSTDRYEDSIRISNSKGLWQKLTPAQVIELAQTICDKITEDIGLRPIKIIRHNFGNNSNIKMDWNRESRLIRVNLNSVGLSPDRFIQSLGHEILGHAVQDALIAGEDIAVNMPEEIVDMWRENKSVYLRPPLPHEYNASDYAARQRYQAYRSQSVEAHAVKAGTDFRNQTRRIVVRLPDDIEFKIMFILAVCILSLILLKLESDAELSFEECILAVYNRDLMAEKPLAILENLHKALSGELGMKPLSVSLNSKQRTSYDRVVFNKDCLGEPEHIIAEAAGETWRACSYEFGEGKSAGMLEYIGEIMERAKNIGSGFHA
jgi:hypothetical protein